jgi:cytoskeletal protein RodZ
MPPEEVNFQTFFAAKLKDRGISIKKLAEATGISAAHLAAMALGKFDNLPSAPYLHGYIIRIGKVLDFDGEAIWEKMKKEGIVKNSGPIDSFPSNRFIRQSHTKFIWIGAIAAIVIIYLAFQLPVVFAKPALTITSPTTNPYTTVSSTLTIEGTTRATDSLSLNGDNVTIAPDGSWQKTVLLQNGANTFKIAASKLLRGETDVTQEVIYNAPNLPTAANATSSASSTAPGTTSTPSTTLKTH